MGKWGDKWGANGEYFIISPKPQKTWVSGGEEGIRTLDTGLPHTPLAGERLQPLGHLSTCGDKQAETGLQESSACKGRVFVSYARAAIWRQNSRFHLPK